MTMLHAIHRPKNADADVIFVHGLGGDHFTTWQHDQAKPEDCWPHWLAASLRNVAVHSLEYQASATHWLGRSMPLEDRAVNALDEFQAREVGQRPIIFIGHSLGGLLIKQLLREAAEQKEGSAWRHIGDQTRLVVFLATPHVGADLASWAARLGPVFRASPALHSLKPHGAHLRTLDRWYREHDRVWQTYTFFEKFPTNISSLMEPGSPIETRPW